jgi:hypothetical protein
VRRPRRGPLSPEERAAIRRAGAEDDARRSRLKQGLPERVEDLAGIAVLAALLRTAQQLTQESTSYETGNGA